MIGSWVLRSQGNLLCCLLSTDFVKTTIQFDFDVVAFEMELYLHWTYYFQRFQGPKGLAPNTRSTFSTMPITEALDIYDVSIP